MPNKNSDEGSKCTDIVEVIVNDICDIVGNIMDIHNVANQTLVMLSSTTHFHKLRRCCTVFYYYSASLVV